MTYGNPNYGKEMSLPAGIVSIHTLQEWADKAQDAHIEANRLSKEYMSKKPGIILKLQDMVGRQGGADFALRKAIKENWTLNDLQDAYNWHRREENRLNTAIAAQVALRQLMKQEGLMS